MIFVLGDQESIEAMPSSRIHIFAVRAIIPAKVPLIIGDTELLAGGVEFGAELRLAVGFNMR